MRKDRPAEVYFYEWSINRWTTSRTRMALDGTGRGVYRELLDLCYAQGSMPNDHLALAQYAGVTLDQFESAWEKMRRHFHQDSHDPMLLVNDSATVFRKNYFRFRARQKQNRAGKRSNNSTNTNEIHDGGSTTVVTTVRPDETRQDNTRQDEMRRDEKKARTRVAVQPQPIPPPLSDMSARFEEIYDRHIIPGFRRDGEYEYCKIMGESADPNRAAELISESHAEWMQFFRDNPAVYRPGIGKWLGEHYYTRKPETAGNQSAPPRHDPFEAAKQLGRQP